jgi:hypothetical protein
MRAEALSLTPTRSHWFVCASCTFVHFTHALNLILKLNRNNILCYSCHLIYAVSHG